MPDTDTEAKLRGIKLACGIDPSAALIPAIQAIQQERDRLKAQLRCAMCGESFDGVGRFACESCIEKELEGPAW